MMTSPANYYEFELKGKSEAQLKAEIRELRQDIRRLSEEAKDESAYFIMPGPDVQLSVYREYLAVARAALTFKKYGIL